MKLRAFFWFSTLANLFFNIFNQQYCSKEHMNDYTKTHPVRIKNQDFILILKS